MGYVFISYSSKNLQAALNVKNVLTQNGIDCWMAPECIEAGMNYTSAIPAAIEGCFAFVLVLSNEAQLSQWVTKELDLALNRERTIVPFHLDAAKLTDQYDFMLAGCQRIEAYSRVSSAYEELIDRLNRLDHDDHYKNPNGEEGTHDRELERVVKTISADKEGGTKKKLPRWASIVIKVGILATCALIALIVVITIKTTKRIKEQTHEFAQNMTNVMGDIKDKYDGGVSVDVSPDGGVTLSIAPNKNDENSSGKETGKDSDTKPASGNSVNVDPGQIIGGLLGGDVSDIVGLLTKPADLSSLIGLGDTSSVDPTSLGYTDAVSSINCKYTNAEKKKEAEDTFGNEYENAVVMIGKGETSNVQFALDKKYKILIGEISCPEDLEDEDGEWKVGVYVKGELVQEYTVGPKLVPQVITLNVENAEELLIEVEAISDKETGAILSSVYAM